MKESEEDAISSKTLVEYDSCSSVGNALENMISDSINVSVELTTASIS